MIFQILMFLLRILQGFIVGAGAIIPGISAGVLCIIFGIYIPLMEVLSHPKRNFKKHLLTLLPFAIGWLTGFFSGAKLISIIFSFSETVSTWLFIGLIAGTFPSLWQEAAKEGRHRKGWIALVVSFLVVFGSLMITRVGFSYTLPVNVFSLFFAGVLWGLSIVVPGMSSDSLLMSLGLFVPMYKGMAAFDPYVLVPMLIGIILTAFAVAKFVNYYFNTHYEICFHVILGLVISTTVVIIPTSYSSLTEVLLSILACAVGFIAALFLDKLTQKIQEKQKEADELAKKDEPVENKQ